MKVKKILQSTLLFAAVNVYAQDSKDSLAISETKVENKKKTIDELRLNLTEDGRHYIKATFLNQTWFRYADYNRGTTILTEPASNGFDIGLRRTRFQLYGQLTDHITFYFQAGQNNFNFLSGNGGAPYNQSMAYANRKTQFFIHDAVADYKVKKGSDLLYIGGGLTIANGLSRFSQPSIGTIMSLDVPIFAQATVDQIDEFSRKLSIYARGQLGKLDYRLVVSDPFPVNTNGSVGAFLPTPTNPVPVPSSTYSAFALRGHRKQYQGFFSWNFLDKESHVTPYMTGTYLGKKRVFNLEAGFITQQEATWAIADATQPTSATNTKYYDLNLWSVALFYDAAVNEEKGTALNAYVGYFNTNYGDGYLRYSGTMNPANGISSSSSGIAPANSQGTAFPMFGTGSVIYAQFGYLLPKNLFGPGNGTLMPYVTLQSAKYDRLDKQMNVFDLGVNWLIKGHTSKVTLDYQVRPTYEPVAPIDPSIPQGDVMLMKESASKGQVILQYQFFF